MQPENARKNNVELKLDKSKLGLPEFQKLWANINAKSVYVVEFDQDELIQKAISALNRDLRVSKIFIKVETGTMTDIQSREQLQRGAAFVKEENEVFKAELSSSTAVKYDLVGKVVTETGLTRKAVVAILRGIEKTVFGQFANNPEEFIIKAAQIINEQKATTIVQQQKAPCPPCSCVWSRKQKFTAPVSILGRSARIMLYTM
ncbi:MAG: hypothetical protein XD78_1738 [Desulfotomaculum sp. 46_296]|nr:MAG: hypothetical protein XD78_1738 [Desulfotomaculum sp. 46_296]